MSCAPGRGLLLAWSAAWLLAVPVSAEARVGDLAPEFNNGQPVVVPPDPADPNSSVTLGGAGGQSDRKLVVAGTMSSYSSRCAGCGDPVGWVIQRFLRDGRLDPGFGEGGVVRLQMEPMTFVSDLIVQPSDQRILIVGGSAHTDQLAFVRLNTDGSLDTRFAGTGIVYLSRPDISVERVGTIALDGSGNAYLAASGADTSPCCTYRGVIASITSDGTPNDWAPNGILVPDTGAAEHYREEITSVAVAGRKVFYTGWSEPQPIFYNPPPRYGLLGAVRRANGEAAADFGSRGLLKIRNTYLRHLLLASDGKLKASGNGLLMSFETSGAKPTDRSFGRNGRVTWQEADDPSVPGDSEFTEQRGRLFAGALLGIATVTGAPDTRLGPQGFRPLDFGTQPFIHDMAPFDRFVALAGNDNDEGIVAVVETVARSGALRVRTSRRRMGDGRVRLRVAGRLLLPPRVTDRTGCHGAISAHFRRRGRVVRRERTRLSRRCRFSVTETFGPRRAPARVVLRFAGNAFAGPASVKKEL